MFTSYKHEFYTDVKSNILEFLETERSMDRNSSVHKLATKLISFVSNNKNKLESLDDHELIFHNSSHFREYHHSLISFQCEVLHYSKNEEMSNEKLQTVIESLYICIYADIKSLISLKNEPEIQNIYSSLYFELLSFYEYLGDKTIKIINMVNDAINFQSSKLRYVEHSNFSNNLKELAKNESAFKKKLEESTKLKNDIQAIKESLEKQKHAFNFVGLSGGFNKLKEEKEKELFIQNWIHYLLMLIVLALIGIKSYWSIYYLEDENFDNMVLIVTTVSTILLIFIMLYFFRISLVNIKSIKSQILQIDLRLTLCQFIHNYENDTSKLRNENMKASFDKFESVIFAPLVATEDQMPATFDGLEQITGLLSSFNKSSK